MTIRARFIVAAFAVPVCLGLTAGDVWAQTEPRRLDAIVDVFGGWDMDLSDTVLDASGTPVPTTDTTYGGANGALLFGAQTEALSFGASADASVRRYSGFANQWVPAYGGTVRLGSRDTSRRSWSIQETISYTPLNALSFFPGLGPGAYPVDYQISGSQQLVSDTTASLGYRLSRSSQLLFTGVYSVLNSPSADDDGYVKRWSLGGRYTHAVSRYSSLYAGYTYWLSQDPQSAATGTSPAVHSIDAGMSYARPLSFSRRTQIFAQVGTTAIENEQPTLDYNVVGSAGLTRQIGRTWNLRASYERSVRFVPAFLDPLVTSAVTVQASGRTSTKSYLSFAGNISDGTVGAATAAGDNGAASYSATVRYRYLLARSLALYSEYFYFQSEFGPGVSLPEMLGANFRRNGIRFGLSFGTALLGERR